MLGRLLLYFLGLLLSFSMNAQVDAHIPSDTIMVVKETLGHSYYLKGRKLNLSVMDWFMADYPEAQHAIKISSFYDQISVVSYSIGGLSLLGGLLADPNNPSLQKQLFKIGGISIGSGVAFQLISSVYRKRAVTFFNAAVLDKNKRSNAGMSMELNTEGLTFVIALNRH